VSNSRFEVKILKASRQSYWYANEIGSTFLVEESINPYTNTKEYRVVKAIKVKRKYCNYDCHHLIQIEDTDKQRSNFIFR